MPLHFIDAWNDRGTVGEWRLPGEPAFANSRALELLLRDLRRYVAEDIEGRSVLVAGHRGAGKTATVTQACRILRNDILRASMTEPALGRRGLLQRPLLVKLVGEGLIAPAPELKPAERKPADAERPAAAGGQAGAAPPPPPANPAPEKPKRPTDPVESALAHITIALYRALALEMAEGFAVHAAGPARDRGDRMELAAQLALELDGTPDPAALRRYWDRLGRLAGGVLWPPASDEKLRALRLSGQGYREVIAVATAAQAFQVCSGAVTYSETNHDSASTEGKTTAAFDIKDMIGKAGALGAGALAGGAVGAVNGALPGVGTGLIVWLLSGAALSWTGTRNRKSERALDYTFLRDRSIQTLDRDLPLVIRRIREAGLTPVFLVDELDKLADQAGTITALIKRLKHLISDYGFFCFLTDRNYFDSIETKVSDEAYPLEHTYFGERVLIVNRPQDLFAYVYGLIGSADPDYALRAAVLALAMVFRSKLNFADLNREINQLIRPDNSVTLSDLDLTAPGRLRLEATIQLAVNEVLSAEDVAERFRTDLGFAQLAIDALYHIARRWQKDSDAEIVLTADALRAVLLDRRRAHERAAAAEAKAAQGAVPRKADAADPASPPPPPPPAPAEKEPAPISPPDLRELASLAERLAGYLLDFGSLRAALGVQPLQTAPQGPVERRVLAQIVIDTKPGMIERVGRPDECRYCFVLDELARDLAPRGYAGGPPEATAGPPPETESATPVEKKATKPRRKPKPSKAQEQGAATPPPPATPGEVPGPLSSPLLEAVLGLVSTTKISLAELVSCRLLPETVGGRAFEATLSDYRLAQQDPTQADARRRAEDGELALKQAFDSYGENLGRALILLDESIRRSGGTTPPGIILRRISRYLTPGSQLALPAILLDAIDKARIAGTPEAILAFSKFYLEFGQRPNIAGQAAEIPYDARIDRWKVWREMVLDFLRRGNALLVAEADYLDIVLAAQDLSPGNLFRSRLIDMDQTDWSRAALAALVPDEGVVEAPYWMLYAALSALGFDAGDLDRLAGVKPRWRVDPEDGRYIAEIVSRATTNRPRGALHVFRDSVGGVPPREIPELKPMLSVGESVVPRYVSGLSWLVSNQLFDEGRDETE